MLEFERGDGSTEDPSIPIPSAEPCRRLTPPTSVGEEGVGVNRGAGLAFLEELRETWGAGVVRPLTLVKLTLAEMTWNKGISTEHHHVIPANESHWSLAHLT